MSKLWDFKFHTSDRNFSGIGTAEGETKDEVKKDVELIIKEQRPDVSIKEIVVEPSVMRDDELPRHYVDGRPRS